MENTYKAEKLVAEKFREELEKIQACPYCGSSRCIGCVTSPAPDGTNRLIFCMNHKNGGVVLSRFTYNPA